MKHRPRLIRVSDVQFRPVSWLWHPYIPRREITILEGDPGIGKSQTTLAIAAGISRGSGLPGMASREPESILILSEDKIDDTIGPRLAALGADMNRIRVLDGIMGFDERGLMAMDAAIGMPGLEPALVIIDPLTDYIGARVDIYRDNETRAIMSQLAELADRHECAMLVVRHLTKAVGGRAIYRGMGSIAFTAKARSVLLSGVDPHDRDQRAIVHIKANLSALGPAVGFTVRDGVFAWTGESSLTADALLCGDGGAGKGSALDDAIDFLEQILANGPVLYAQIAREAKAAGIAIPTARRAKKRLGIRSIRSGEGSWSWALPEPRKDDHDHIHRSLITLPSRSLENGISAGNVDHLARPSETGDGEPWRPGGEVRL